MKTLLEKLMSIEDSVIDFARDDLDPSVWLKHENGRYSLHPDAQRQIIRVLDAYPDRDLRSIADQIRIVGSIATNQYQDNTDVDVHVVPRNPEQWGENEGKAVKQWFDQHRDDLHGYIGEHPIEIYIQLDPNQDLLSDGVYSILQTTWLKGPKLLPPDYDPYEDFSSIEGDLRSTVEDADLLLGELKRDVIDYDVIKAAIGKMSTDQKRKFLVRLEAKLQEIEDDIQALFRIRGELVRNRTLSSPPATPEQALHDVELAKKWKDTNALFKFVARYQYLRVIGELKDLLGDGEIEPGDVETIKQIAGVPNVP